MQSYLFLIVISIICGKHGGAVVAVVAVGPWFDFQLRIRLRMLCLCGFSR